MTVRTRTTIMNQDENMKDGKYEEALERARQGLPIDKIFPELHESDDERIRKAIEGTIRVYGKTQGEWLCGYDMDTLVVHLREAFGALEKQKEQKPEIKYVYPKFRKGDVIEPITPNGHCMPVRVVDIWNGSYSCRSDDDKAYLSLPIRNEDEYRLAEQQPAEWSEEDKKMLEAIVGDIHCGTNFNAEVMREANIREKWLRGRLKSLRPQPNWKPSNEQMKCLEDCVNRAREIHNASTSGYDAYPTLNSLLHDLKSL